MPNTAEGNLPYPYYPTPPEKMDATVPFVPTVEEHPTVPIYYDQAYLAYWPPMMVQFPATPTSAIFYPDTTVKSGSELGDTPPSVSSVRASSKPNKKSPQEDPRYRLKRDRNNEAAQKSRRERTKKEKENQTRIGELTRTNQDLEMKNRDLQNTVRIMQQELDYYRNLSSYGSSFNNENQPPPPFNP
ncbi:hypothetical protein PFISCL1PPCAC_9940 [Pristionchus fissidentatus]|uniref:BZIP domain-containing protein n=1 Tax=Pristionchus fissidentatus TaxID=1538716 RepID=A0AAV5VK31_9BILA|nr:hypothetical protein PFISCL1PPCAC_9940 [Pristionchus fissidentatus]